VGPVVVGKPVIDHVKFANPGVVLVNTNVEEAPATAQAEDTLAVKLIFGFERTQM